MPTAVEPNYPFPGRRTPSPVLVAAAGWLLPGAGYWLVGERARALVVGITIIILFTGGTLIGGVRSIQVPGYGETGGKVYTWNQFKSNRPTGASMSLENMPLAESPIQYRQGQWVLTNV